MNTRYTLLPQMRDYDKMGQQWSPYLMFFNTPNYSCDALNTDLHGFRMSYKNSIKINTLEDSTHTPISLLVGGSFVFGVGATSDQQTIPSFLNASSDDVWLNFGGRAFSSTQELLLFHFFHQKIKNIKKVVILSGVNNLALHYLSQPNELGSFFFQSQFYSKMNTIMSKKRWLLKMMLQPFFKDTIDYAHVSIHDLIRLRWAHQSASVKITQQQDKENILHILQRDLMNWKLVTSALGIELHYVLQPFYNWIDKEKSKEEKQLFAELDRYRGRDWKILAEKIDVPLYHWFLNHLKKMCHENNIHFFDMNQALSEKKLDRQWLFIDRIHCTDEGNAIIAAILKENIIKI